MDEGELVRACQSELPYVTTSFGRLMKRHEAMVYGTCLKLLASPADADEVTQDTFLRVFQHLKKFDARSSFKTWLYAITRNQCLSRLAEIRRRRERHQAFAALTDPAQDRQVDGVPAETEGDAIAALATLSYADREMLVLRHVAGLRLSEVAEILELSPSAAKMRHQRGLERLREAYDTLLQAPE